MLHPLSCHPPEHQDMEGNPRGSLDLRSLALFPSQSPSGNQVTPQLDYLQPVAPILPTNEPTRNPPAANPATAASNTIPMIPVTSNTRHPAPHTPGFVSPNNSKNGRSFTATRYAGSSPDALTCCTRDHAGTANVSRQVHSTTTRSPLGGSMIVLPDPPWQW